MKPGTVVEITKGTRKAQRGVVLGVARSSYKGVADLEVRMEDGSIRWLGPEVLRVLALAATESDDDVLSPLRRTVSG